MTRGADRGGGRLGREEGEGWSAALRHEAFARAANEATVTQGQGEAVGDKDNVMLASSRRLPLGQISQGYVRRNQNFCRDFIVLVACAATRQAAFLLYG